jgi:hypothetical protein
MRIHGLQNEPNLLKIGWIHAYESNPRTESFENRVMVLSNFRCHKVRFVIY